MCFLFKRLLYFISYNFVESTVLLAKNGVFFIEVGCLLCQFVLCLRSALGWVFACFLCFEFVCFCFDNSVVVFCLLGTVLMFSLFVFCCSFRVLNSSLSVLCFSLFCFKVSFSRCCVRFSRCKRVCCGAKEQPCFVLREAFMFYCACSWGLVCLFRVEFKALSLVNLALFCLCFAVINKEGVQVVSD